MTQDFLYTANNQPYRGLFLAPLLTKPKAAVVLLPDWRGQSALARDHARFLVDAGCVVVIADLYGNGFSPDNLDQVSAMVKGLIDNRMSGVEALAACVAALKEKVSINTRIFCVGYSAGGMIALDYARSGAAMNGVILCSALLKTAMIDQPQRIHCPVLMLQGTQDVVSPMTVINDLIAEMDAVGNDVRLVLFSQTHHAFDNPEAGSDPNARLVYSQRSAELARRSIVRFITECD